VTDFAESLFLKLLQLVRYTPTGRKVDRNHAENKRFRKISPW
jgi:hypothetical protein